MDDYDETKVAVTNAGGGTDSGTNITWNIGTVNINETGSVSYTVSIKPGVASGTAIINDGTITGYSCLPYALSMCLLFLCLFIYPRS